MKNYFKKYAKDVKKRRGKQGKKGAFSKANVFLAGVSMGIAIREMIMNLKRSY